MKAAIELKLKRIVESNLENRSQRDSSSPISLHDGIEDMEAFTRTVEDIMNSSSIKSDSFSQNPSAISIMSSSYLASSDLYRGFFPLQRSGKKSSGSNRFPDYHDLLATQNTAWGNQRVMEGIAAAREEKYETAIEFCNAALSVLPNSVQAFVCRGASYANISKYEKAVLDFERALELDPLNHNASQYLNKIKGKEQRVTPNTIILPVESAQTRMVFAERHMYPSKVKTKDLTSRGPSSSSSSKTGDDSNTRSGAIDTVNGYTFEREDRDKSSDNDSQISKSSKKRKREKSGKQRKSSSSKNEKEKKNHRRKEIKKRKKEKNDST